MLACIEMFKHLCSWLSGFLGWRDAIVIVPIWYSVKVAYQPGLIIYDCVICNLAESDQGSGLMQQLRCTAGGL